MKYDNIGAFQRQVENTPKNHLQPVYLILSSDQQLSSWMMDWTKKFFEGFETCRQASDLQPSLFSKEVLVLLEWEELLDEVRLIEHFLAASPKGTHLILSLPKLEASNAFYKKVEKAGVVLHLGSLKPWEKESFFMDYLLRRAQKERVVLAPDAAKAIAARSQGDPFAMDSNYEKLCCWKAEEKKITLNDVNTLGPFDEEETLFKLSDALLTKKRALAQEISSRLMEQGAAPLAVLKTIRNQCVILFELQNHFQGRVPLETITSKHAYLRGNILEQKMNQARLHSLQQIKTLILKVDELERYYKNTGLSDDLFFDLTVATLSY